jgi:hypothetical protein
MSESGQCRAGAVDWFQAKTDLGRPPVDAASAVEQRVKAPGGPGEQERTKHTSIAVVHLLLCAATA